jgi:hypothetical protein
MPSKTCNRSENDSLAINSWRASEGNPPQILLVSNAVSTGKWLAAEMLGEYLIPPVVNFNVNARGSTIRLCLPKTWTITVQYRLPQAWQSLPAV